MPIKLASLKIRLRVRNEFPTSETASLQVEYVTNGLHETPGRTNLSQVQQTIWTRSTERWIWKWIGGWTNSSTNVPSIESTYRRTSWNRKEIPGHTSGRYGPDTRNCRCRWRAPSDERGDWMLFGTCPRRRPF